MTRKHVIMLAVLALLTALVGCRSAHVTSAILYIDQQMYQHAVDVLHEGLEYSPNEAEAYFYLGESHTKLAEDAVNDNEYLEANTQYEMAYNYYIRTLELDELLQPRVEESLQYSYVLRKNAALTDLESARGAAEGSDIQDAYFEAAEGHFRLAYAAYPDSVAPIKNVARMKILQSEMSTDMERRTALLNESLDLLDQVLESNPDAYALQSDKASVLNKLGRNAEAGAIYDQLIVDHPDDIGLLIDVASLSVEEEKYERAADLYVRVADIYESDDDVDNDEDILVLRLQAGTFYGHPAVLRYADAIENFDKALDLEMIPEQSTMFQKLKLHYDYGLQLKKSADATGCEDMPDEAKVQFEQGVNVGNAMVDQLLSDALTHYYLGLCHGELCDQAESDRNFELYRQLESQ